MDRRTVLLGGASLLSAPLVAPAWGAAGGLSFSMPDGACDTHHHVYDPRFPYLPDARDQAPATVPLYLDFRKQQMGTSRDVIVLPSAYGTDNDPLFFFQAAMGEHGELAQNTRSIAVIHSDVSETTLKDLNAVGVRGVRIQFSAPEKGFFKRDEILPIAKRIAPYGWHVQFHLPGPLLADMESLILSLPTPVVIDHKGHAASIDQPQFKTARKLLDTGRGWMKVSGINMDSKVKGPTYADSAAVVHEFIRANPDRIVWGSNWPLQGVSDMSEILNVLASAAGSPELLRRVLVDNPEALYGFDPAHRPPAPR